MSGMCCLVRLLLLLLLRRTLERSRQVGWWRGGGLRFPSCADPCVGACCRGGCCRSLPLLSSQRGVPSLPSARRWEDLWACQAPFRAGLDAYLAAGNASIRHRSLQSIYE